MQGRLVAEAVEPLAEGEEEALGHGGGVGFELGIPTPVFTIFIVFHIAKNDRDRRASRVE